MLAMEQILCELNGEDLNEQGLPPGFRFHPTDEELVTFYLASKVFKASFCGVDIVEVDLNRCEPWELPDVAKMGEREWYFYSLRDRKYPTGLRTNRATGAGYWKATGKDREVYSGGVLIGMKKTLVFYKGRAPRGEKTKWVMHEYRLDGDFSYRHACKEEWVICRIFHKNGDKKNNPMLLGSCQSYNLLESALSNSLPPLLESATPPTTTTTLIDNHQAFQHPLSFQIHQNDFIKSEQQQPTINNNNSMLYTPLMSSSCSLFKSLLSHEKDYSSTTLVLKQQQFKAESSSTHLNLEEPAEVNYSNFIMDIMKMQQQPFPPCYHQNQHPLFFEVECNSPAAAPVSSVHDISTSIAFNSSPTAYQTMLDPHINIVHAHAHAHGESWLLDA